MDLPVFPPRLGEPRVAHADPDFLAVVKPAGIHTAPSAEGGKEPDAPSLAEWVFERFPEIRGIKGRGRGEGGLLHRLDRETSGLVLFARSEEAFLRLSESAAEGRFRKEYALLARPSREGLPGSRPERGVPSGVDADAWGRIPDGTGRAAADPEAGPGIAEDLRSLLADALDSGRGIFVECRFRPYGPGSARVACAAADAVLGRSRASWGGVSYRTEILAAASGGGILGIRAALTRGFRHQIRAHLAWIGLPLEGDGAYGGRRGERLALHAAALEFPHPRTGAPVRIEG